MSKRDTYEEWLARKYPDDDVTRFGKFFFQADVAHIVMLHAAAMKAGWCAWTSSPDGPAGSAGIPAGMELSRAAALE